MAPPDREKHALRYLSRFSPAERAISQRMITRKTRGKRANALRYPQTRMIRATCISGASLISSDSDAGCIYLRKEQQKKKRRRERERNEEKRMNE